MSQELSERIDKAINMIVQFGGIDGDHHKTWVLDQAVRALCGCPEKDESFGTNEQYEDIVREAKAGEDGPETYSWDVGVAP